MKKWEIEKISDEIVFSEDLKRKYGLVILNLLSMRGLKNEEEIEKYFNLDYEKDLGDPLEIFGMREAVERIKKAKEKNEKIAIFGDYDADGVSASALIYEALSDLEMSQVICYIPDRQLEGYGMNEDALGYIKKEEASLIITVDCGITNIEQVEKAKELGMDVIITDHHHALENFPAAAAVINPNLPNSGFTFKDLAGVGVAFKLVQALYQKMAPEKMDQLKWLLDLVALGTIADCVSLTGENRVLVKYGLIVFSKTRRVGLRELFKVGRIDISEDNIPDVQKIAFQVAPRINAAGRMDHASVAYKLLIEKNAAVARDMALEVESNNQKRQKVTTEIFREVQILAQNSFKDKKFIFAENPHWSVGILGLVAGKIMDEFQKPTIILQDQEEIFVGSLRSVPEVNIVKCLEKCSDLLIQFGGHSQAAGIKIKKENLEKFYNKMSELIEKELGDEEIIPTLKIDLEITAEDVNWEFITELKKMEPFGQGNEEPVFCMKNMQVVDFKIVGNGEKHLKLSLRGEGSSPKIFDAIGFRMAQSFPQLKKDDKIDIVCNLQEDEWNGNKKIQLKLVDMRMVR